MIHLADSCPQFSQTYIVLSFAISTAKIQKITEYAKLFTFSLFLEKLLPFSRFLLKCRCTGRFKTGVVAPTTPMSSALYLSGFEPHEREKGSSFFDFLKNSMKSVTD